jgi:hypothetical protein
MASNLRKKPAVAAAISALMAEKHGVVGAALVGELGATATFAVSLSSLLFGNGSVLNQTMFLNIFFIHLFIYT